MKLTAHPLAESLPRESGSRATAATAAATPLDERLIARLRGSLAMLLSRGDRLVLTFYALMFERSPALRALFPQDMTRQRAKLARTLVWIVEHLNERDKTIPALQAMGWRHAEYGVKREHYPFVRDTLLDAMRHTAGNDWNDRLADDWRLSIDLIARHMLAGSIAPPPSTPTDPADALAAKAATTTSTAPG